MVHLGIIRIITTAILYMLIQVSEGSASCTCQITSSVLEFPNNRLLDVQKSATSCTQSITSQQITEVNILLDQLHYRLLQLENDVTMLEKENDGGLFGAVSLRIIEIELADILDLITKLNTTDSIHQDLTTNAALQLEKMRTEMGALEVFDRTKVVQKTQESLRLKRDLAQCKKIQPTLASITTSVPGNCPYGHLRNVTGPSSYIITQYGTSYPYGAWGRDPTPAAGKEDWYWLVALTSSNVHANYVRLYSSYSAMVLGVSAGDVTIASANPTTNTIQGPNTVLYGDALYYACYNSPSICRFNMTARTITTATLPGAGYNNKFPYCHLDACYTHTDIDLSTDESGVWVVYTSAQNFGNVVLSQVQPGVIPTLGCTWNTSLHKRTVTNTFIACGVLYATRYLDKETEELFYSFDPVTGQESFNLGLRFKKISTNIQSLHYNPQDRMLYAYSDSYVLTYQVIFDKNNPF